MTKRSNDPREPFGRLSEITLAHQQAPDYTQTPAWAPVGQIGSTRWLGRAHPTTTPTSYSIEWNEPADVEGTAVDDPPDAPTHHRGISANTPQPRYSRV